MKFRIGDKVSVLDEAIEGVVVGIKNNEITIETTDDFMMTFFVNELIKINDSSELDFVKGSFSLDKAKNDIAPTRKQKELRERLENTERGVPEFDLHIEKLVKSVKGMSNFDILTIQLETAQRHIDFAIRNRIPKIVLIHGVGEGVLKSELDFLFRKYPQLRVQEASYRKYGIGAVELYVKQNHS